MTSLRRDAIARAGLTELVARRVRGERLSASEIVRAADVDLLALGAAADEARKADVGDDVVVHAGAPPRPSAAFVIAGADEARRGTDLFRALACARLALPHGGRLCVDVDALGVEIAQAALAFGVSDWSNALRARRGLPIAGDDADARRRELQGYIGRAKRVAVFVEAHDRGA